MPFIVKAEDLGDLDIEAVFGLKDAEGVFDFYNNEEYEKEEEAFFENSEILVRISDFFGWDDMIRLKDGGVMFTDRNCGFHTITDGPVDRDSFLRKFKEHMDLRNIPVVEKDVIGPLD